MENKMIPFILQLTLMEQSFHKKNKTLEEGRPTWFIFVLSGFYLFIFLTQLGFSVIKMCASIRFQGFSQEMPVNRFEHHTTL